MLPTVKVNAVRATIVRISRIEMLDEREIFGSDRRTSNSQAHAPLNENVIVAHSAGQMGCANL